MRVAIVTCISDREKGKVHVIQNPVGMVTEDVLRSLAVSQVVLGTREIVVMKHTDCGLGRFREDELRGIIAAASGAWDVAGCSVS